MKLFILFLITFFSCLSIASGTFDLDAQKLSADLKKTLVKSLKEKINQNGAVSAIPFCHDNVKLIAKRAAGKLVQKYDFGRTSHKIRNPKNQPPDGVDHYLEEFKGTKLSDKKTPVVYSLPSGKKVFLDPLYVGADCLICHGENISSSVLTKIKELYPTDQATGFKLGEFRGFIWIKEK